MNNEVESTRNLGLYKGGPLVWRQSPGQPGQNLYDVNLDMLDAAVGELRESVAALGGSVSGIIDAGTF